MSYLPKRILSFFMIAVMLFSTAMPLFAIEKEQISHEEEGLGSAMEVNSLAEEKNLPAEEVTTEGDLTIVEEKVNESLPQESVELEKVTLVEILKLEPASYPVVKTESSIEADDLIQDLKVNVLPKHAHILASDGQTYKCDLVPSGFNITATSLELTENKPQVFSGFILPEGISTELSTEDLEISVSLDIRETPATITLDENHEGGSVTEVLTDKLFRAKAPEAPVREGYTFLGWFEDQDGTGSPVIFENNFFTLDKVLYARWDKDQKQNLTVQTNVFGKLASETTNKLEVKAGSVFGEIKEELEELVSPVHETASIFSHWEKDGQVVQDNTLVSDGDEFTAIYKASEGYREIHFESRHGEWKELDLTPNNFLWASQVKDVVVDGIKMRTLYGLVEEGDRRASILGTNLDEKIEYYYSVNGAEDQKQTSNFGRIFFTFGTKGNVKAIVTYKELVSTLIVRFCVGYKSESGKPTSSLFDPRRLGFDELQKVYLQRIENGQLVGDKIYFDPTTGGFDESGMGAGLRFRNLKLGTYTLGYDFPALWLPLGESGNAGFNFTEPHAEFELVKASQTRWVCLDSQLYIREITEPMYYLGVGITGKEAQDFMNDDDHKVENNLNDTLSSTVAVKVFDAAQGKEDLETNWENRLISRSYVSVTGLSWTGSFSGSVNEPKNEPTDPDKPLSFLTNINYTNIYKPSADLRPLTNKGYSGRTGHVEVKLAILPLQSLLFDPNGGNFGGSIDAKVVQTDKYLKAVAPDAPTKDKSTFIGWFDEDGNEFDVDKQYLKETTFKAKWETVEMETVNIRFFKDKGTSANYNASKELVHLLASKFFIVNTATGEKFSPDPSTHNTSTGFVTIKDVPVGTYSFEFKPEEPFSVIDFYEYSTVNYNYKSLGFDGIFKLVKGTKGNVATAVKSSIVLEEILPQEPLVYEVEIAHDFKEANALIQTLKDEVLPKTTKVKLASGEIIDAKLGTSGFRITPVHLMSLGKSTVYSWIDLPDDVSNTDPAKRLETKVVLSIVPKKPPVGHKESVFFATSIGGNLNVTTIEDFKAAQLSIQSVDNPEEIYTIKDGEIIPHYSGGKHTMLKLEVPVGEYKLIFNPIESRVYVGAFLKQNAYHPFDIENETLKVEYKPADPKTNYVTFVTRGKKNFTLSLEGEQIHSLPAAGKVLEQSVVKVTLAPKKGDRVKTLTANGKDVLSELVDDVYTFTMTEDTTVKVEYEKDPNMWHRVSFESGENGKLEGTLDFIDILKGTKWSDAVTVPTPVANEGYRFKVWEPKLLNENAPIEADLTFKAIFEEIPKRAVKIRFIKDFLSYHNSYRFSEETNRKFAESFVLVNKDTQKEFKLDPDTFSNHARQGVIKDVPEGSYEIRFTPHKPFEKVSFIKTGGFDPESFEGDRIEIKANDKTTGYGALIKSTITLEEILPPEQDVYPVVKAKDLEEANALIQDLKRQILPQTAQILASDGKLYECALFGSGFDIRPTAVRMTGKTTIQTFFDLPEEISKKDNATRLTINVTLDVRENQSRVLFNENYDGGKETEVTSNRHFKVEAPADPIREGYQFLGWYRNAEGTGDAFDFEVEAFVEDAIVYAKWQRMIDKAKLNDLIAKAEGLDLTGYSEKSTAKLKKALIDAKAIQARQDATQKEVDRATVRLQKAMDRLRYDGWVCKNNKWYYYQNGKLKTGWFKVANQWYYANSYGEMQTGWI